MNSEEARETSRKEILSLLARKPFQKPESTNFCHGRLKHFLPTSAPRTTWSSQAPPRGPGGPAWLTASELQDRPEVLQDKVSRPRPCPRTQPKVRYLARLLSCSRHTVLLTGAGASTSAGVKQTARGRTGAGYSGSCDIHSIISQAGAIKAAATRRTPSRICPTWAW